MPDVALCEICGEQIVVEDAEPTISSADGTVVHRSCQEALEREPNAESFF
jgi:hypothetical protein